MERRAPLDTTYQALGARFTFHQGRRVPERFSSVAEECAAARQAAGVADWSARGFLIATGADRVRFLHRMLSNEVQALETGQGNYSTLLTPQAHLVADLYVLMMDDHLLLETHAVLKDRLRETLERYIIADDVAVEDQSKQLTALALEGPAAADVLRAAGAQTLPGKELNHTWVILGQQTPVHVVKLSQTGGEGYELIFLVEYAPKVWDALTAAQAKVAWKPVGLTALNVLRAEAGIPWYGVELQDTTLPLEAGLDTRAISYTKGCYVGQEIIERIRSRGHVNRKLLGLLLEGAGVPGAGTKLTGDGKEVGEITTAVYSPTLGRAIALAYIHREHWTPGTRLQIASGGTAEVTTLPFFRPA